MTEPRLLDSTMAGVNLRGLEKELAIALEADRRYARENDAKFRAIHQKVGSYEEFRDIVKASHLQPLDRADIIGGSRHQPWNPIISDGSQSKEGVANLCGSGPPTSGQEFIRQWRQLQRRSHDQYKLLVNLASQDMPKILKAETSVAILGNILQVLQNHFSIDDVKVIIEVLLVLSEIPRFSLSIELLNRQERAAIDQLFTQISSSLEDNKEQTIIFSKETIDYLYNVYKIIS